MNNRLNEYLSEVETHLRPLPPVDREQEVAEIAQHLDALIRAHESAGQTEAAATNAAIAQFGAAHAIGKQLSHAEKRKRFAPLVEAALFSVAAVTLLELMWQSVVRLILLQNGLQPPYNKTVEASLLHWSFPFCWNIGFAAIAFIALRCGPRGMYQKAFEKTSPISAAAWWIVLMYLCDIPHYLVINSVCHKILASSPSSVFVGLAVFSSVFGFAVMWVGACLMGRRSTARQSVASAVGVAAAVMPLMSGLERMKTIIPPVSYFHSSLDVLLGCLILLTYTTVYGALSFFIVRHGVHVGEKSRLLRHAKQAA